MPSGSSNVESLLTGNVDADGAQDDPAHVVTIADIFKGPDFGDEVSDPGSRIMMQDTPGAPTDIPVPAPDVALIEGVPVAVPQEPAPHTDDDPGYYTHPLTGRRYSRMNMGKTSARQADHRTSQ